jgi:hypothetical protein
MHADLEFSGCAVKQFCPDFIFSFCPDVLVRCCSNIVVIFSLWAVLLTFWQLWQTEPNINIFLKVQMFWPVYVKMLSSRTWSSEVREWSKPHSMFLLTSYVGTRAIWKFKSFILSIASFNVLHCISISTVLLTDHCCLLGITPAASYLESTMFNPSPGEWPSAIPMEIYVFHLRPSRKIL